MIQKKVQTLRVKAEQKTESGNHSRDTQDGSNQEVRQENAGKNGSNTLKSGGIQQKSGV